MTTRSDRDKRLHTRVFFSNPVQASSLVHSDRGWDLLSLDLSEGGVRLLSPEPFAVNARLLCELEGDSASEPIRVVGRVTRVEEVAYQERYDVGVEFIEMSDSTRERLRVLVGPCLGKR